MYRTPIISLGVLVVLCSCGYFFVQQRGRVDVAPAASKQSPVTLSAATGARERMVTVALPTPEPSGDTVYTDTTYRFSFKMLPGLHAKRLIDGSAATFIFQNTSTHQGFQIYVQPYGKAQVTQTQFLRDEPSGVRIGAKNITIDGAKGTSFYSTDTRLADTAEIWFIHGGYLYEVTTLKPLSSWLSQIMSTWQFL